MRPSLPVWLELLAHDCCETSCSYPRVYGALAVFRLFCLIFSSNRFFFCPAWCRCAPPLPHTSRSSVPPMCVTCWLRYPKPSSKTCSSPTVFEDMVSFAYHVLLFHQVLVVQLCLHDGKTIAEGLYVFGRVVFGAAAVLVPPVSARCQPCSPPSAESCSSRRLFWASSCCLVSFVILCSAPSTAVVGGRETGEEHHGVQHEVSGDHPHEQVSCPPHAG